MDLDIKSRNIANVIIYGRLAEKPLGLGTYWNGWTHMSMKINPRIMKLANI
ncbi:MAG: hypothetical protein ACFE9Q_01650 [Candidatus Hodarchaeota archaeon]